MDKMEELPKCLLSMVNRGSENPQLVGMAPVEGGMTIIVILSTSNYVTGVGHRIKGGGGGSYGWGPLPSLTEVRTRKQVWTLKEG